MSADSHKPTLVAKKTVENFVARAIRLYEQEPGEACASSRFGLYVRRWGRWTEAGLAMDRTSRLALWAGHVSPGIYPLERDVYFLIPHGTGSR